MNDTTFDLTIPIPRQLKFMYPLVGLVQILNGVLAIERGDQSFGIVMLAFGVMLTFSGIAIASLNSYSIGLRADRLEIHQGWFKHFVAEWSQVSQIRIQLMSIDISTTSGETESILFAALPYAELQETKPKMISEFKAYAAANQIPITDTQDV